MEWIIAIVIGILFAAGIAALRRGTRLHLVVGLILLSQAVNLEGQPAFIKAGEPSPTQTADPLPQALVLTAIVIGLGVNAYLLALLVRGSSLQDPRGNSSGT